MKLIRNLFETGFNSSKEQFNDEAKISWRIKNQPSTHRLC